MSEWIKDLPNKINEIKVKNPGKKNKHRLSR
jgi:hypothetical protein